MFFIDKSMGIHISRGDSVDLTTRPEKGLDDGSTQPIILSGNACVVFTVKPRFGDNTLIKRILTEKDYAGDTLAFSILSSETDITPGGYEYSFLYVPDKRNPKKAYTYAQGDFVVERSVSRVTDLEGNR